MIHGLRGLIVLIVLALPPVWAQASTPQPSAGVALTLVATPAGGLVAGTWCGVYERAPDSDTWKRIPGIDTQPTQRIVALRDGVLLATTGGWWPGGLWRYAPGGGWSRVLDASAPQIAADPAGTRVYAAAVAPSGPTAATTILRSDDRGQHWHETATIGGGSSWPVGIAVARDRASGDDVVLLAFQFGKAGGSSLVWSRDHGQTWESYPGYGNETLGRADQPRLTLDAQAETMLVANTVRDLQFATATTHLYRAITGDSLAEIALPDALRSGGITDLAAIGDQIVVAGQQRLYARSLNGTSDWNGYDQGLGAPAILDLTTITTTTYAAATSIGVYLRKQPDDAWRAAGMGLPVCTTPGQSAFDPIPPFPDSADHRYIAATGHALSSGFKRFWDRGGLAAFGFPLSEEFDERNSDLDRALTTQYFERVRFEYHADLAGTPYEVQLGRLGAERLAALGRDWRLEDDLRDPFPASAGPCRRFDVGGDVRSVCGPFLSYWQAHGLATGDANGSLRLFGLPLTAPQMERNPDGDLVLTQWFERARFEWHPDNAAPYQVLLGRLGAETLTAQGRRVP